MNKKYTLIHNINRNMHDIEVLVHILPAALLYVKHAFIVIST